MNLEEIRKRLHPVFKPFRLRTSDGRQYTVRDPLAVMIGPRVVGLIDDDGHSVSLDLIHVVAISDIPPRVTAGRRR